MDFRGCECRLLCSKFEANWVFFSQSNKNIESKLKQEIIIWYYLTRKYFGANKSIIQRYFWGRESLKDLLGVYLTHRWHLFARTEQFYLQNCDCVGEAKVIIYTSWLQWFIYYVDPNKSLFCISRGKKFIKIRRQFSAWIILHSVNCERLFSALWGEWFAIKIR